MVATADLDLIMCQASRTHYLLTSHNSMRQMARAVGLCLTQTRKMRFREVKSLA